MTVPTLSLLLGAFVLVNCQRADMRTKKELNNLFNSRVKTVESMARPKQIMPDSARSLLTTHSGVRMTLEDGRQYLIHNVPKKGPVITDAGHMLKGWRVKETVDVGGHATVGGLRAAAGNKYRVFGSNCHDTRRKVMKAAKRAERTESRRSRMRSG